MKKTTKQAESNVDLKSQQIDDQSELYINLLCDRYKHRGVTTKVKFDADVQANQQKKISAERYNTRKIDEPQAEKNYRSGEFGGVSYMTSDDFAKYYKEKREFNTPGGMQRTKSQCEETEKQDKEKNAQANSISPKKAKWLAIKYEIGKRAKSIKSNLSVEGLKRFSKEWFPYDAFENRREGGNAKFPKKSIPAIIIVTVSLFLIVSGSVMVSHAEIEVSKLENRIIRYEAERDELDSKLQTGIDLMAIRKWALDQGMVSREYVNSKFVDLENNEITEKFEKEKDEGIFRTFLRAIGLIGNKE